jgi:hypothetical protein
MTRYYDNNHTKFTVFSPQMMSRFIHKWVQINSDRSYTKYYPKLGIRKYIDVALQQELPLLAFSPNNQILYSEEYPYINSVATSPVGIISDNEFETYMSVYTYINEFIQHNLNLKKYYAKKKKIKVNRKTAAASST